MRLLTLMFSMTALAAAACAQVSPPATVAGSNSGEGSGLYVVQDPKDNRIQALSSMLAASSATPTEKGSYLGAAVSEVPTVLRDQLKLQRGFGLVVNLVEKDSPAESAGLHQSDVLQKLDDQLLINPQQFAVLVRTRKAGSEVRLSLIREAKPMELVAKVAERDLPVLGSTAHGNYEKAMILLNDGQSPGYNADPFSARGWEWADGQNRLTISDHDGRRHLTARDKAGKIIYDGPIDSEQQMANVPAELIAKVRQLLNTSRQLPTTRPNSRFPLRMPVVPAPGRREAGSSSV